MTSTTAGAARVDTVAAGVDFDYIRELVRDRAAIVLEPGKAYLAESRLSGLARQEGLGSVHELVARLRAEPFGALHRHVVEAMTTNETSFFRDIVPFDALRKAIVPELLVRRRETRTITIWCAASSTGQEPYSIAMSLREHFPELAAWTVRILATDINRKMVERTREARYSQLEVNRGLPAPLLVRWFQKDGAHWQVREELRRLVEVREMNLAAPWPAMGPFDVIFIRNVLIYFDLDTKRRILAGCRGVLRSDGYLFLGSAETTINIDDAYERLQLENTACYRGR